MNETKIILIRHGDHDPAGRFQQHGGEGLTARGRGQAAALADRLVTVHAAHPIDVIMTSKAARTIETAQTVAAALHLTVEPPTCELCENHPGQAAGLTYREMEQRFGPTYADVPGAEYFPDWLPRGVAALRTLAERHHGQTVIAVTHHAVIKASFVALGQMPPQTAETIPTDHTGMTVWTQPTVEHDPRRNVWAPQRHNDTAHSSRDRVPKRAQRHGPTQLAAVLLGSPPTGSSQADLSRGPVSRAAQSVGRASQSGGSGSGGLGVSSVVPVWSRSSWCCRGLPTGRCRGVHGPGSASR